jgi:uncharacterized protein YcfJ
MNRKLVLTAAALSLLGATAAEAHGRQYTTVRVRSVEPVYETVIVESPVTVCSRDYVERRATRPTVAGQTLAGAVIGAAIGRQFGDGSGRDALTVLGAAAGSAVANRRAIEREQAAGRVSVVREPVETCTTQYRRHAQRQLTGYWVEYRHRGRNYRILSHERPGTHIVVQHRS